MMMTHPEEFTSVIRNRRRGRCRARKPTEAARPTPSRTYRVRV
jgi:hypothetical protein